MSYPILHTYEIYYVSGGRGAAGAVQATSRQNAKHLAAMKWGGRASDYRAVKTESNPAPVLHTYEIYYVSGGRGAAGAVQATSRQNAKHLAAMKWGGRASDYRAVKTESNPAPVKGHKVKGGRSVTLHNFTGSIIRKSNGQVVIKGRGRKK